ncbi:MAG: tetratricopeptide repeat protein [Bacteroidales bacterium]|nr:tetratricopeptide repeat protein [Bacteroidales bacterium]
MSLKTRMIPLLAATLLSAGLLAAPPDGTKTWREAMRLYENGMYEQARLLFSSMRDDPLSDAYEVLCALKMQTADSEELLSAYRLRYPSSSLSGQMHFERGRILFDQGRYQQAAEEFSGVSMEDLSETELSEYVFKNGYCAFCLGHYAEAAEFFTLLDALPQSDYSAPGRYFSGVMLYENKQFAQAEADFWKAAADPRFTDLTNFYIVDCEFNQKNYDFTIREGSRIYESLPAGRRERMARMLSESYLIKGDSDKAREYYDEFSHEGMNRKDLFYAGTVLYSVDDYAGAIENFTKMVNRTDSLGQVANYHLANAFLRTHDQVSAMRAFRDAAELEFDPQITEDAAFNYAKLAFDLNKDTSGFSDYIKRWSTKARGDQIYGYMALAALVDKDYAAAVQAYDNIEELGPEERSNYTKANFLRGEELFQSGSYRDAQPYFRATAYYLPRTDRLNQLARYFSGESAYRSGNYTEARQTFTDLYNAAALDGMPEGRLLPYNIGYSLFKTGDYAGAARWFDTYINSADELVREDALNRRADCDFGRRDYKAAVSSYQKVITEYFTPDNIYPYYQQAVAYGLSGDKRRKVSTLLHIEDASPDAPLYDEALYELGRSQMDLGNNNDAVRSFTRLRRNTRDKTYVARALTGLGMVKRNMQDYDGALESYKEVVSRMPDSEYAEEAMTAIESIYSALRQPEKFLEYVEQNSLAQSRSDSDRQKLYFNTAEQLYLAGNYPQAASTLRRYIEDYPDGADRLQAEFYLAECLNTTGEKEQAVEHYAAAAGGDPSLSFSEMARLRYAELSYSLERYQDACKAYQELLSTARMDANRQTARTGIMRSAYRSKDYLAAIVAATEVSAQRGISSELRQEASYIEAKSSMATSQRDRALALFRQLGADPSTAIGAESRYLVVQDLFDTGRFEAVGDEVYAFSQKAGDQSYWLARAYVVLGDSFAELGRYAQAKATYESIRDGYEPEKGSDDIAVSVQMRLTRLATLMNE